MLRRGMLTARPNGQNLPAMDLDDRPPPASGDLLALLARQDLDPLSVDELGARIAALEAEAARCRAHLSRAVNHRATAEGLFRR